MAICEPGREDTIRWGLGLLFAVGVHIGMAVGMITWNTSSTPPSVPPPAVLIELAALPAAPPVKPSEVPPDPKPEEAKPKPPEVKPSPPPKPLPEPVKAPPPPVAKPEPESLPEMESKVEPEVALPKPVPRPKPPTREKAPPPAPQLEPMPEIAPVQQAQAVQSWNAILLAHLNRYKHYPSSAKRRQHEGVAYLWFVMDRAGRVLSARINRSSGYILLDEEARAMVKRAEPLPVPPPEVAGERIELIVPVEFFLR